MTAADRPLVLAVSPSPRGMAFILFHDPFDPIDWGIKDLRGSTKSIRCLGEFKKLLRRYVPDVVVLEAGAAGETRRGPRIRTLLRQFAQLAEREGVTVQRYTRAEVRATFHDQGATIRPEIARAISIMIPALAPRLPRFRKIWMSEDPRQTLFDAAALGLTHHGAGSSGASGTVHASA